MIYVLYEKIVIRSKGNAKNLEATLKVKYLF